MGELFSITCPICGIEIGIDQSDLDKPLICECGYEFIVDSERNVTPVDYNAVPKACEPFLTQWEKDHRRSAYYNDFKRITLCADFIEGLSVERMLELRKQQIKLKANQHLRSNLGCLAWVLIPVCGMLLFVFRDKSMWPIMICPGFFVWIAFFGVVAQFFEKQKEVDEDPALFDRAREREISRLLDNAKVKARWKDRMIREEVQRQNIERARREMVAREEAVRRAEEARLAEIRKLEDDARRNDEGMVAAIRNGVLPFDEFVAKLDKGDGHGYEERLMRFIQLYGFNCVRVANSADHGVDLILENGKSKIAIQCKFKSYPIGNDAVQEVYTGKAFYQCDSAWVVSNCKFTKHAKVEARGVGVELIQHNDVFKRLNTLLGVEPIVQSKAIDVAESPKKHRTTKWKRRQAAWMRKMFDRGVLITTTEMRDAIQK